MRATPERALTRRDRIYAGHVALAGLLCLSRMLGATRRIAAWSGGEFASTSVGRGLALVSVLAGVIALCGVAWLSFVEWRESRDRRVLALLALLGAAIAVRKRFDVFDLVYIAAVAILAVLWFQRERVADGAS